ncbi:hypothetical protein ACFB49_42870 [Sphingomonas sp. DBB INV C78]|uniref:hypothetical protein n=1 Tax=Sphingomonas sp. DBB INV C78 TaxID=3349434 RepID=UPI0036D26A3E
MARPTFPLLDIDMKPVRPSLLARIVQRLCRSRPAHKGEWPLFIAMNVLTVAIAACGLIG